MNTQQATRNEAIRNYVVEQFIANGGKLIFISDIAEAMGTNAKTVRAALDEEANGFEYGQADRWSGNSFSGRFIQCWYAEPSKTRLIKLLAQARSEAIA